MKVQLWSVDKVFPYQRNPRRNEDAVEKVAASIKEFGFKQPIVVDKESVVIVGHTRLLAALRLGMKEVPVLVAADLTPAQPGPRRGLLGRGASGARTRGSLEAGL